MERQKRRDAERVRIQKMVDATSMEEIADVVGVAELAKSEQS